MTLGIDMVLFGGLLFWLVGRTSADRSAKSCSSKWGPFVLTALGSVMVTWDTVRHVLLDHGGVIVPKESLTMYKDADHNLSVMGFVSKWSAIVGIVLMFIGVAWIAKVFEAMSGRWSGIRSGETGA